MSMVKNIKDTIANFYLKLELKDIVKVKKPIKFSFAKVGTIGVLFDATTSEDLELVKRYIAYLKENRKKVKVIGYFNVRDIPQLTYSKLEFDFFSTKELNWFGKPTPAHVNNFMEEEFDLLIDFNIADHFPLKYIAALSKANFKVGKFNEADKETYDLMIDTDAGQTLKYFMQQIDIYMAMLNKNDDK